MSEKDPHLRTTFEERCHLLALILGTILALAALLYLWCLE